MADIASTIKFCDICKMFENIKKAKLPRKDVIIRRYYDSFCRHREAFRQQIGIANEVETGCSSFYCVLRMLIPHADTAREAYNLQVTALGRLYIRILQLATDSIDATRLEARTFSNIRGGDYADVVYSVLFPRCHNKQSDLTLKDVHDMLDIIAKEQTPGKELELVRFSEKASAQEQKWLIRLLLKSMSLGIGEQRIFAVLHPLAKDIYQRCTNLARVCILMVNNKLTLNDSLNVEAVIEPFQLIRPMLCERFPGNIEALMATDVLYMEIKMDGERFQLHYKDGCFKYLSRNGTDYTNSFGKNYNQGSLTPDLQNLLPIGLNSIIIDGEMMVWDKQLARFRDKGENTDVKHLSAGSTWRPCFLAYDLLYLDGSSLLEKTYIKRTYKLKTLLKEKPGVLQVMKAQKILSLEDFNSMFQDALDANAEGIVLKKQNSKYMPGVRNGGGWYKDKADYIKGLTTEFDVLIIGGFYNRNRTFIESFLLGVLKLSAGDQPYPEVFSIGKVANNTQERVKICDALKMHWNQASTNPPPLWYHYKAEHIEGRPDVWIEPKVSTILQVKAADLTSYSAFYTTKSLHFPRIEAWRNDKVWNECMTLQEYINLCQGNVGLKKINKRQLQLSDLTDDRKKQKITPTEKRRIAQESYEKNFDASKITVTSDLLEGFIICVLSGAPRQHYPKIELQILAARNGAKIYGYPLPNNPKCICVAGEMTFLVERLKNQVPCKNNIVRMEWLLRVCERQQINLRPKDMIAMTDDLEEQFSKSYDKFGDAHTDYISSVDEMLEVLADIDDLELNDACFEDAELIELEEYLLEEEATNYFLGCLAYFYNCSMYLSIDLIKIYFQQHGGNYIDDLAEYELKKLDGLKYIFIDVKNFDKNDFDKWLREQDYLNSLKTELYVINIDWIKHSHEAKRKLDIDEYMCQTYSIQTYSK